MQVVEAECSRAKMETMILKICPSFNVNLSRTAAVKSFRGEVSMMMKIGNKISNRIWNQLLDRMWPEEKVIPIAPMSFEETVRQARMEWNTARAVFDSVSDPDLIDHAIYAVEAAERRYMYLVKLAKEDSNILSS